MTAVAGPSRIRLRTPLEDESSKRLGLFLREELLYSTLRDLELEELQRQGEGRNRGKDRGRTDMTGFTDAQLALRLAREESEAAARFDRDHALAVALTFHPREGFDSDSEDEYAPDRRHLYNFIQDARSVSIPPGPSTPAAPPMRPRRSARHPGRRHASGEEKAKGPMVNERKGTNIFQDTAIQALSDVGGPSDAVPAELPLAGDSYSLTGHDCVACQDPIRGAEIKAPCGHYYDKNCVLDLFEASTRDETLFPPRCCRKRILFRSVKSYMTPEARNHFHAKAREFLTAHRVYCSNSKCSRFLGPQEKSTPARMYHCSAGSCRYVTCARCRCRVTSTSSHECQPDDDEEDKTVLALGRRSGWARCPGCAQLIELNLGCFHMTCRCKTEFCYICRAKWKTCSCPQWNEGNLIVVAEDGIDDDDEIDGDEARMRLFLRTFERVRAEHVCNHEKWGVRLGKHRCQNCTSESRMYLWRCRRCTILACSRCKRTHRLYHAHMF